MEGAMDQDLAALAARLRGLPPSCGPVRLIAVDGHAGSGKSTFAGRLAAALGGGTTPTAGEPATGGGPFDDTGPAAPVLHLDDLATHDELFAWTDRLREQVIGPLSEGRSARYGVYDWVRRSFTRERTLAPAPVVLLEGVGAGRAALRPYLACLLWMELPGETAWARGRRRDGPGLATFWDGWIPAERAHFAADPSRPYADFLVTQGQVGYTWHKGPVDAR
ncbi:uridine kinase [Streptomyces sp. NPDC053542]|uniref:uridine kinase n=1 Tax=Streptomyces sp. NPDC053542 TaxID=3365710 RepID=UPI0037CFA7E6